MNLSREMLADWREANNKIMKHEMRDAIFYIHFNFYSQFKSFAVEFCEKKKLN